MRETNLKKIEIKKKILNIDETLFVPTAEFNFLYDKGFRDPVNYFKVLKILCHPLIRDNHKAKSYGLEIIKNNFMFESIRADNLERYFKSIGLL